MSEGEARGRKIVEEMVRTLKSIRTLHDPNARAFVVVPVIRIIVAWDINDLNPNKYTHRRLWIRTKSRAKEAAYYGWYQAGCPRSPVPVDFTVVYRRRRELDDDNAAAGLKHLRDVLFCGLVTEDDRPRFCRFRGIEWEKSDRMPEIEFRIEARGGTPCQEENNE